MSDKELIKQEIERLYSEAKQKTYNGEVEGEMCAYDKIISFIDSLPEESTDEANCTTKNDDLEEEINNYIKDNFFGSGGMDFFSNRTKQELNSIDVANIAYHFAEWQKDKMNLLLKTEYEKGLFDWNEAMMKYAIELHIVESFNPIGTENEKPHGFTALYYNAKYPDFYPITGQTVKVIPFKEVYNNEQDCRKESFGSISRD